MIIKDLGAVTAYAYAVGKGYTGTEEEFATLMASYATVAEEAAESAESASTSATSASASAQTATSKASEASTAAQTATAKAEEAQADADAAALDASQALSAASTATTKASEAAQSASDAVTAKTAAQTAQTVAEGSATTAQTAAQTATQKAAEAAESARTLTIDPTLTQSGQAADSKVVGDEIDSVKEDLNDANDDIVNIDATVYGRKNYVEKKKLKTDTTNKGSIVNDKRYDVTDYIDIAFVASGTSIKVNYGTIPESTIFVVYNADHEFIDSWSLSSTANARVFTFNYASMIEPAYVRFAFQHGYDATIKVQSTDEIVWEKQRGSGVDDIKNDYMSIDKYIDVSNVNRCDPSKCTSSKTINANGTIGDNTSYYISDYMPIYPSETLYFFRADTGEKRNVRMFAAYDGDKNVLKALGSNDQVSSIAQSGKMAFVRCTFAYQENINYVPNATCVLANQYPDFCPAYGNYPSFNSDYLRKRINVYATDTESQIIRKFISAYNYGNCDMVFECADYTFGTELAKINTDYGMKHNEIPIGNNCRYFFNGASLTATLDLANLTPAEGDDEFYCNFFGCQRRPSSFELHDGVLIATDTRYVVHDESTAYNGSYKHLYHNMELHYHTNLRQEAIRKCLGGGTGSDGVVEIIGCKFITDGTSECASFHGNLSDVADAKFDVIMTNCWLSNGFRVNQISEHQTARVFYTGNSALIAPVIGDRCTLTAFLNEIRS